LEAESYSKDTGNHQQIRTLTSLKLESVPILTKDNQNSWVMEEWLDQAIQNIRQHQASGVAIPEPAMIAMVLARVQPSTKVFNWWRLLPDDAQSPIRTNFETFCSSFLVRFKRPISVEEALCMLSEIKMANYANFDDYYDNFVDLQAKAQGKRSLHDLKRNFMDGLSDDLRLELRLRMPRAESSATETQSLDALFAAVRHIIDQVRSVSGDRALLRQKGMGAAAGATRAGMQPSGGIQYGWSPSSSAVQVPVVGHGPPSYYSGRSHVHHPHPALVLASEHGAGTTASYPIHLESPGLFMGPSTGNQQFGQPILLASQSGSNQPSSHFHDGLREGRHHSASRNSPHQQPPSVCFRCQQPGHLARACPNRTDPPQMPMTCHRCGVAGHISWQCRAPAPVPRQFQHQAAAGQPPNQLQPAAQQFQWGLSVPPHQLQRD